MSITYKTTDVFGISRDLPLNYATRHSADDFLIENLTRDKHLVIYGSSKQGKTSLRKHCLKETDYIVIHCSNKWTISDINAAILKQAGYEITQSTTKTSSGKNKIYAKISALFLPCKAEAGVESEKGYTDTTTKTSLELDPDDVNDIIAALKEIKFDKYIILEDFHYLIIETQKDFSVALKAFHESSKFCFIIIGVWLEENRLTVYNGDLTGRVVSVNADKWEPAELKRVIQKGEELLNIKFDDNFVSSLLGSCFANVHLLQEACYQCCIRSNINNTQTELVSIGKDFNVVNAIKEIVNQQTGRFNSFLTQFADGFSTTELEMYKWLLYPVLTVDASTLEKGLRQKQIRDILFDKHPRGRELNSGNLTQALQSCASLQVYKGIKPIILDYDQTNGRLSVVDRSFLIWLTYQNKSDLVESIIS